MVVDSEDVSGEWYMQAGAGGYCGTPLRVVSLVQFARLTTRRGVLLCLVLAQIT